jgi:hypothetical protein
LKSLHKGSEIGLYYRILKYKGCVRYDENGKLPKDAILLYDSGEQEAKSFVIAYLLHIEIAFSDVDHNITDTGNVARLINGPEDINMGDYWMYTFCADDEDEYGIQIGSDDTAETSTDYALNTRINDGNGGGEMEYGNHAYESAQVVGANVDFESRRVFTNASGGNVDVKEIAKTCLSTDNAAANRYLCLAREVIGTVTVADTETLEVRITERTTA